MQSEFISLLKGFIDGIWILLLFFKRAHKFLF